MDASTISVFFKAFRRIVLSDSSTTEDRAIRLRQLFQLVYEEMTNVDKIIFPTLFSRIAYASNTYKFERDLKYWAHYYRRLIENTNQQSFEDEIKLASYVLVHTFKKLSNESLPDDLIHCLPKKLPFNKRSEEIVSFYSLMSGMVVEVDFEDSTFTFIDQDRYENTMQVRFNVAHKNEHFNGNISALKNVVSLPLSVNLLDVEVDKEGFLIPSAFVFEPDYLVDVTAVAECFSNSKYGVINHLVRKFLPKQVSKYLILGNVANFLLDDLIVRGQRDFEEIVQELLKLSPLQFAVLSDSEVIEIVHSARTHYANLMDVILTDFEQLGINTSDVFLESSFYSRKYGLQGRLDLFHFSEHENKADIIELKSGKAYMANVYGLAQTHYIQTLLYDLMIQSVYQNSVKPSNYILYSGEKKNHLRYAPSVKAQQFDAMRLRNDLFIQQQLLMLDNDQQDSYISTLKFDPEMKGFFGRDIKVFDTVYSQLTNVEKEYFNGFVQFVSREHHLAKIGEHGIDRSNGLAALWLEPTKEKEERFAILNSLEVKDIQNISEGEITLDFSPKTNRLANFRIGDICVLYPFSEKREAVLRDQIFKASILELHPESVKLRLRSKQIHQRVFEKTKRWNIEPDMLDSSFNHYYKNLFQFASAEPRKRALVLGQIAPSEIDAEELELSSELSEEQAQVLSRMVQCEDYFLLWGPPGTGKTSVVLKHFINHLYEHSEENVLILAYTNRAVDEICSALNSIDPDFKNNYLRLGSKYSVDPNYKDQLIDAKIKELKTRMSIRTLFNSNRIYVSTVSSILGRTELFDLISFDTVVIDEASQIIEPMINGLITRFHRFVMIGDHKQLPAVVVQTEEKTEVKTDNLKQIGLQNYRDSLFERLYLRALDQNWIHAIGQLSAQGRMHQEIMKFPNQEFYQGSLKCFENIPRLFEPLISELLNHRVVYIPTEVEEYFNAKMNLSEAEAAVKIVKQLKQRLDSELSIGIITPYRAQIALMKKQLKESDLLDQGIRIDTVERFQGAAKDVIILSLCTNSLKRLNASSSNNKGGVDRKLNVALTRARNQLFILGNEQILTKSPLHARLLKSAKKLEI